MRPIDPLFLDPEGEFHAFDDDRAKALDPIVVTIDRGNGVCGDLTQRYAWLPPTFGAADKARDAIGINANTRFPIIKAYHGLVFSRNGRIVDVQSRTPWTTFINNDRYIRVEVEFSAALDEAFGITTSKQQVSLSPEMWDHLRVAELPKVIEHLRSKVPPVWHLPWDGLLFKGWSQQPNLLIRRPLPPIVTNLPRQRVRSIPRFRVSSKRFRSALVAARHLAKTCGRTDVTSGCGRCFADLDGFVVAGQGWTGADHKGDRYDGAKRRQSKTVY